MTKKEAFDILSLAELKETPMPKRKGKYVVDTAEAINILRTRSCYECTWGCTSAATCTAQNTDRGCGLSDAVNLAIHALEFYSLVVRALPMDFTDVLNEILRDKGKRNGTSSDM